MYIQTKLVLFKHVYLRPCVVILGKRANRFACFEPELVSNRTLKSASVYKIPTKIRLAYVLISGAMASSKINQSAILKSPQYVTVVSG